jgi:hypothetical protein
LPTSYPSALRLLLAGSSLSHGIGYQLEESQHKPMQMKKAHGLHGAFALQPTFMFDDVQWWSYCNRMRRKKLYQSFGTWTELLRTTRVKEESLFQCESQTRGLVKANAVKQCDVRRRREELYEQILPLWQQLTTDQGTKGKGRPSVREPLLKICNEQSLLCSDRDLRYLCQRLSSSKAA